MNRSRRGWWIALLVAGLLVLAGCGGAQNQTAGASDVTIAATEFAFAPAVVNARVGQPITIVFQNDGAVEHDWSIAGLPATDVHASSEGQSDGHGEGGHGGEMPEVHVAAMSGEHGSLTFTPTKAGRYEFTCTVAGHKEAGMKGTLIVEE
jgi:uncharacterized cupredoxin-like copper-binding protein